MDISNSTDVIQNLIDDVCEALVDCGNSDNIKEARNCLDALFESHEHDIVDTLRYVVREMCVELYSNKNNSNNNNSNNNSNNNHRSNDNDNYNDNNNNNNNILSQSSSSSRMPKRTSRKSTLGTIPFSTAELNYGKSVPSIDLDSPSDVPSGDSDDDESNRYPLKEAMESSLKETLSAKKKASSNSKKISRKDSINSPGKSSKNSNSKKDKNKPKTDNSKTSKLRNNNNKSSSKKDSQEKRMKKVSKGPKGPRTTVPPPKPVPPIARKYKKKKHKSNTIVVENDEDGDDEEEEDDDEEEEDYDDGIVGSGKMVSNIIDTDTDLLNDSAYMHGLNDDIDLEASEEVHDGMIHLLEAEENMIVLNSDSPGSISLDRGEEGVVTLGVGEALHAYDDKVEDEDDYERGEIDDINDEYNSEAGQSHLLQDYSLEHIIQAAVRGAINMIKDADMYSDMEKDQDDSENEDDEGNDSKSGTRPVFTEDSLALMAEFVTRCVSMVRRLPISEEDVKQVISMFLGIDIETTNTMLMEHMLVSFFRTATKEAEIESDDVEYLRSISTNGADAGDAGATYTDADRRTIRNLQFDEDDEDDSDYNPEEDNMGDGNNDDDDDDGDDDDEHFNDELYDDDDVWDEVDEDEDEDSGGGEDETDNAIDASTHVVAGDNSVTVSLPSAIHLSDEDDDDNDVETIEEPDAVAVEIDNTDSGEEVEIPAWAMARSPLDVKFRRRLGQLPDQKTNLDQGDEDEDDDEEDNKTGVRGLSGASESKTRRNMNRSIDHDVENNIVSDEDEGRDEVPAWAMARSPLDVKFRRRMGDVHLPVDVDDDDDAEAEDINDGDAEVETVHEDYDDYDEELEEVESEAVMSTPVVDKRNGAVSPMDSVFRKRLGELPDDTRALLMSHLKQYVMNDHDDDDDDDINDDDYVYEEEDDVEFNEDEFEEENFTGFDEINQEVADEDLGEPYYPGSNQFEGGDYGVYPGDSYYDGVYSAVASSNSGSGSGNVHDNFNLSKPRRSQRQSQKQKPQKQMSSTQYKYWDGLLSPEELLRKYILKEEDFPEAEEVEDQWHRERQRSPSRDPILLETTRAHDVLPTSHPVINYPNNNKGKKNTNGTTRKGYNRNLHRMEIKNRDLHTKVFSSLKSLVDTYGPRQTVTKKIITDKRANTVFSSFQEMAVARPPGGGLAVTKKTRGLKNKSHNKKNSQGNSNEQKKSIEGTRLRARLSHSTAASRGQRVSYHADPTSPQRPPLLAGQKYAFKIPIAMDDSDDDYVSKQKGRQIKPKSKPKVKKINPKSNLLVPRVARPSATTKVAVAGAHDSLSMSQRLAMLVGTPEGKKSTDPIVNALLLARDELRQSSKGRGSPIAQTIIRPEISITRKAKTARTTTMRKGLSLRVAAERMMNSLDLAPEVYGTPLTKRSKKRGNAFTHYHKTVK